MVREGGRADVWPPCCLRTGLQQQQVSQAARLCQTLPCSPCCAVYRRTFRRCLAQNKKFYQRFPMDVERVQVRL